MVGDLMISKKMMKINIDKLRVRFIGTVALLQNILYTLRNVLFVVILVYKPHTYSPITFKQEMSDIMINELCNNK